MITVYVPQDSSAVSVGADEVAAALEIEAGERIRLVRNGTRGMLWLEPLVEVETERGRVGYGPVRPGAVPELLAAGMLEGADHELCQGVVDELPWMRDQHRLCFARVGVTDPVSTADYENHGGLAGLRKALEMEPAAVVQEVTSSGLRGRGGAGFPAGIKWNTVLKEDGPTKFVCCNADEGDSGTFADRMLLEGDPFCLIEGMLIAAHAVEATEGYIYVRSEYPDAVRILRRAIDLARGAGWLGEDVLGSGLRFDLHVRVGAGAYICGEETSMLESLEGNRGMVRPKPPIPAITGLFGRPTVVNNVLTLASVPAILADGAESYAALGTGRSLGTQVFQLAGNIARGGAFETSFGLSIDELVNGYGGGTRSGRPVRAVQIGGPLGSYVPPEQFELGTAEYELRSAVRAAAESGTPATFTVDHPTAGVLEQVRPGFADTGGGAMHATAPPPRLGEHTRRILAELGIDTERVAELEKRGVVRQADNDNEG